MLSWFEKTAPIRAKFKVLLFIYGSLAAVSTGAAIWGGASLPAVAASAACLALTLVVALVSSKLVCTPYVNTVVRMEALAAGDLNSPVNHTDHRDCVGRLTKAMDAFREKAQQAADGETVAQVVRELGTGLAAVAEGNMTFHIEQPFGGGYDNLRQIFNDMVSGLEQGLSQVAASAQSVHSGSTEIRAASEDLAHRTEQQAASLEETTAAMAQVTGMVRDTARGASEVRGAIDAAHKDASEGGAVVDKAVNAMDAIEKSSQEIEQIINLIDGIAFQTNLLALNAGVEAARAGDAGKGFAVVANEVRALAQRSADAAKDIKTLITTSTQQVSHGVDLVGETGKMLARIVVKIADVNGLIAEIAQSTEVQSTNLQQVNGAVNDMDRMTQQNAAMVEESAAAARSLSSEADQLSDLVSRYQLRQAASARRPVASAPRLVASAPVKGNVALKPVHDEEEWAEF
ncbi:MAG TPA: methyl-accepting chemotaxis protein [Sphingobium sp.]|uniref:methyl-accepting chemotaxis protein n=1 Tax=Sphingobium sp. TaxID=1912891 RepID=UPI002ED35524